MSTAERAAFDGRESTNQGRDKRPGRKQDVEISDDDGRSDRDRNDLCSRPEWAANSGSRDSTRLRNHALVISEGWTGRKKDFAPSDCDAFVTEMNKDAKGATKADRQYSMFVNCAMTSTSMWNFNHGAKNDAEMMNSQFAAASNQRGNQKSMPNDDLRRR
jgi:hypothetical protein